MLIPIVFATTTAVAFEKDTVRTSAGAVEITFIGHASLLFTYQGRTIFVDPYGKLADYSEFPKADIILVTHAHYDHLDTAEIDKIRKGDTKIITTKLGAEKLPGAIAMKNGDTLTLEGVKVQAVPAYNIKRMREKDVPFHPKGEGNGYVLTIGDTRIYIAGDTENIPEMAELDNIDIAFLPMNLPYTMQPEETAAAARAFMPRILYPYHYGETDPKKLVQLLKTTPEIEVRIRQMR